MLLDNVFWTGLKNSIIYDTDRAIGFEKLHVGTFEKRSPGGKTRTNPVCLTRLPVPGPL